MTTTRDDFCTYFERDRCAGVAVATVSGKASQWRVCRDHALEAKMLGEAVRYDEGMCEETVFTGGATRPCRNRARYEVNARHGGTLRLRFVCGVHVSPWTYAGNVQITRLARP